MTLVQRRLVSLGVMMLCGAAVAGYAYYGTFKGKQAEEEQKGKDEKMASFAMGDVKEVRVEAKGESFEMIGDGEGDKKWRLTKPLATTAEKTTVESLVTHFADMKKKRSVEGGDLKAFGLEPPQATVKLKTADGKEHVYFIGKKNSFDDAVYVKHEGDTKVAMVPSTVTFQVERDLFAWREKRLATFEDKDAQKIVVELHGKPGYTLEKKGEDWALTAPMASKAEKAQVTTLLSSLRMLRAKAFANENLGSDAKARAPFGLDKPDAQVTLSLGAAGAQVKLAFGSTKVAGGGEKFYARQENAAPVLELGESGVKKLDLKVNDLRDKALLTFNKDEVKKIKLTNGGDFVLLEKKKKEDAGQSAESWELVSPEAKPANESKVSNLLFKLSSLRAKAIVADQPTAALKKEHGLEPAVKQVTFYKADGSEAGTIVLGTTKGEETSVLSQNGARIDLVDKSQLSDIVFEAKHWAKEDAVAQTPPAALEEKE